ncbi:MAG: hypothetical protein HOH19_15040 [Kordiimonadaceae bacterium]|nr:hypothetical protein [Kordiimonadaceae bacterium]MBT6033887.1 hypothetical protein [Kordiimonadaceae bacterium]
MNDVIKDFLNELINVLNELKPIINEQNKLNAESSEIAIDIEKAQQIINRLETALNADNGIAEDISRELLELFPHSDIKEDASILQTLTGDLEYEDALVKLEEVKNKMEALAS